MNCPFCESKLSKVIDKRAVLGRGEIRRRRECLKCAKRYTTYEGIATLKILVLKKNGKKEEYDREKIKRGLVKALEKRPDLAAIEKITNKIESHLRNKGLRQVPSQLLGNMILRELKRLDGVAYLRFASVYRTFSDPADFAKELKSLS